MATIKEGYGSKPLEIRVYERDGTSDFEIWTEMLDPDASSDAHFKTQERLHYATVDELVALRDEINEALRKGLSL